MKADEALKSISTPDKMDSSLGTLVAADAARLHGPLSGRVLLAFNGIRRTSHAMA